MDMGPMGNYLMFKSAGGNGGVGKRTENMPMPFWMFYFQVEDIHLAVARVKEHGGQVVRGPHAVPDGNMVAMAIDPQGAAFGLHARAPGKA